MVKKQLGLGFSGVQQSNAKDAQTSAEDEDKPQ